MGDKPTITCAKNGPLLAQRLVRLNTGTGRIIDAPEKAALCRCGASKKKPFCDGAHGKIGWTDEKKADRTPDKRVDYQAKGITIHDNRGICAHAGFCTDGLKEVFRMKQEPWIDPDGASVEKIVEAVKKCPSGALSCTIDGTEHRDRKSETMVYVAPNGPYAIKGGVELEGVEWGEGASKEHYNLCRCGDSKNKPFCDGAHWNKKFDEDAPKG